MRDSQVSKVYRWEFNFLRSLPGNKQNLTEKECRKVLEKCFVRYERRVPMIKFVNGHRRWARGGLFKITIPNQWARQLVVLVHEATHTLLASFDVKEAHTHGAEFVRLFIELMALFKVEKIVNLRKSAKRNGLKIAPAMAIPRAKKAVWGKI